MSNSFHVMWCVLCCVQPHLPSSWPLCPPSLIHGVRHQTWWPSSERLQDQRKEPRQEELQGQEEESGCKWRRETAGQSQGGWAGGEYLSRLDRRDVAMPRWAKTLEWFELFWRCTTRNWRLSMGTSKTGFTRSTCTEGRLETMTNALWMTTGLSAGSRCENSLKPKTTPLWH